jgi:putative iron-dependent peroxidase
MSSQPGILAPLPRLASFLTFRLEPEADPRGPLAALAGREWSEAEVMGIGASLFAVLGSKLEGLREIQSLERSHVELPVTPRALLVWLRGDDRGELVHRGREIVRLLGSAFALEESFEAFQYRDGRDLSGFVDGTENPAGLAAEEAALVRNGGPGLDGSSFVAVQCWVHELGRLDAMTPDEQSQLIGRDKSSNEELDDAPPSAHVKRTAQESFEPEAFVVRRSMPWSDGRQHGLVFVSFGHSLDAFEAQLRRMVGAEDGVVDGLFRFTHPVTGSTFWCPPLADGHLDLRKLLG